MPPAFATRYSELAAADATFRALFPNGPGRMADVDTLLHDMDAAGIDHAVIMGFGWTDRAIAREANDYLLSAQRANPDRITAFCSVNPAWGAPAVSEAKRCIDLGMRGIGELHADTQGFNLDDCETLGPVMAVLQDAGLPINVHASEPVGHQYPGKGTTTPEQLLRFASAFPDNRIVMAHLGGGLPFYAAMPEVCAALANVWFDTAAIPYLYRPDAVVAAAITAGADRILFGSDYPLLKQRRVIDHVTSAPLTGEQHDKILGANAQSLLGRNCDG